MAFGRKPISSTSKPSEGTGSLDYGTGNLSDNSDSLTVPESKTALTVEEILEKEKNEIFYFIREELEDDDITNIEWDGDIMWLVSLSKGKFASDKKIETEVLDNMAIRVSNVTKVDFNKSKPVLEASTKNLRISIWHESRCGKKSVVIRKVSQSRRLNHDLLVKSKYAPENIINLLENCIVAHMNIVIGGLTNAGKTELLKYLSAFIPSYEKAGVYEDNKEIHYKSINPGKNCVEFVVDRKCGYAEIIKYGLRHNVLWQLLSESRGPEVFDLLNGLTNGAKCMTTVHLSDLKDLGDRFYTMSGKDHSMSEAQFLNTVYRQIDVAVLIACNNKEQRYIKQVAFYTRENNVNDCTIIYEDGEFTNKDIPASIMYKFKEYHKSNPFVRTMLEEVE